jgi:hypothetical protein
LFYISAISVLVLAIMPAPHTAAGQSQPITWWLLTHRLMLLITLLVWSVQFTAGERRASEMWSCSWAWLSWVAIHPLEVVVFPGLDWSGYSTREKTRRKR